MLLALFVPLASAGAQDAEPAPEGQRAEEGGTLNATPESATNMVDDPHTISVTVTGEDEDGEPAPEEDVPVVATVDDPENDVDSYEGGLPDGASEECEDGTDESGVCGLTFNDEDADYDQATSGKDRIRVFRDDNENDTWDDDEDYDFVTKTWVDEEDEGETERLWGTDRIGTAVDVSQDHWADHDAETDAETREDAQNVVIARADDFPDALAGTPFAVLKEAPLLLTFPDNLDERTETELQRVLDPEDDGTVYLLGGNDAISENVEQTIEDLGYEVQRLWGLDRFDTAIDIAETTESDQGTLNHIFIARAHDFPDALAGGAAAANVANFDPESPQGGDEGEVGAILLTLTNSKDPETHAFITAREDATTYALGGPNVNDYGCAEDDEHPDRDGWQTQSRCDESDEDTADWTIFGADRQETSRAIAEFFFTDPAQVGVARGDKFPDALTGGAHIGQYNGPILLTQTGALDADPERYLCFNADTIDTAYIYGGDAAIAPDTRDAIEDAISGEDCFPHPLPGYWVGS